MTRKASKPAINGDELLQTFRHIVEKKIDLPQDAANELILAAIVDTRIGISGIAEKMDGVCEDVKIIRENDIPHLMTKIESVDKRFKDNPSIVWLLRFKTRKTLSVIGGVATIILGISAILGFLINNVPWIRDWFFTTLGLPIP